MTKFTLEDYSEMDLSQTAPEIHDSAMLVKSVTRLYNTSWSKRVSRFIFSDILNAFFVVTLIVIAVYLLGFIFGHPNAELILISVLGVFGLSGFVEYYSSEHRHIPVVNREDELVRYVLASEVISDARAQVLWSLFDFMACWNRERHKMQLISEMLHGRVIYDEEAHRLLNEIADIRNHFTEIVGMALRESLKEIPLGRLSRQEAGEEVVMYDRWSLCFQSVSARVLALTRRHEGLYRTTVH